MEYRLPDIPTISENFVQFFSYRQRNSFGLSEGVDWIEIPPETPFAGRNAGIFQRKLTQRFNFNFTKVADFLLISYTKRTLLKNSSDFK